MGIGLINIPEQYHLVAKLWDILPANLTMLGNAFGLSRRKAIYPETQ